MSLVQSAVPDTDAITLVEAKAHLRVDTSTDDDLITRLMGAATARVEDFTGRQLVTATWTWKMDAFPDVFCVPRPPMLAVTSLGYVDTNGDDQTLTADTDYTLDISSFQGRIVPAYGESWPTTRGHIDDVTLVYTAGYGAVTAVPDKFKQAILLILENLYEHRGESSEIKLHDNPATVRLMWPERVLGGL